MNAHRHTWSLTDDNPAVFVCAECPATAVPCTTCGRVLETTGRTCDDCVSKARNHLRAVRDMYRALPDVIAAAAGLHAIRYDQRGTGKTRRATDTSIIGGAAFVMAGPGYADKPRLGAHEDLTNPGTARVVRELVAAEQADPPSVLGVLTFWEDVWRQELHHTAAARTNVDDAVMFLVTHTDWAAQNAQDWDGYLTDLHTLWSRLRFLTGASQPPVETGVPCPYCAGTVLQHWSATGLQDTRRCSGCGIEWGSEARFMLAIREAHQALPTTRPDELVTIDDAKRIYKGRVRPNLFDLWVHRGTLVPDGRNERGVHVYRLGTIDDKVNGQKTGVVA